MNSGMTHQIEGKNRAMADAWNCQIHYVMADSQIDGKNRITVDLDIINEY
jgi:hypothetical protein